ncbi:MAG: DUF4395 domain-containing protein [Actinomycetota bacterium]
MSRRFPFPHPVNETSARIVAGGVVIMSVAYAFTGAPWLLIPLTYGFFARVTTGPAFSPLGALATKVITPRLNVQHRLVAGPPKRFAQFVGLVFSAGASVLWLLDLGTASRVVAAALAAAAFLEAALALCLGCVMFGFMMRLGVIPERVCEQCNNLVLEPSAKA